MSAEELGWPLPPETADYYLRSIETAQHNPELDADFFWEPSPKSRRLSWLAVGKDDPSASALPITSFFFWSAIFADFGLVITGILGSMRWHTVWSLCNLIFWPALGLSMAIIGVAVAFKAEQGRLPCTIAGFFARSLTGLAAFLAGHEGSALLGESDDHLAGGSGRDPVSWAKVMEAAGFVVAGACYRGQGWADAGWRPVDAVLRSRFLSGLFVAVPTIVIAFEVLTHKGTMTLFTSLGSIFGTWTFLAGAIKGGRKYRDVEPPKPKARQAKE